MTQEQPRSVPYSIEAEQSVLGALMLDANQFYPIRALLAPEDFYRMDHQILARSMFGLLQASKTCDLVTVTEALKLSRELDDAGGFAYVAQLAADSWSAANAEAHAKVVRDYSQRRKLIALSGDLAERAWRSTADEATAFLTAEVNVLMQRTAPASKRFQEAVTDACGVMALAAKNAGNGGTCGAPTGLPSLDRLLGGFSGPRLYVLAARPKCGKSALLNQFAINAAMNGWPGLIVSRELGSDELAIRAMSMISGVNVTKLHRGHRAEADRASDCTMALGDLPLWLDDQTSMLEAICAQIAVHKYRHGITWAAVDHLGLVRSERRFSTRDELLHEITWTLKETAKRLQIPIVALSQLNRSSEREGRKPGVHDLRDSGNIEQNADAVIMMHIDPDMRNELVKPVSIGVPANRTGPGMWLDAPFQFDGSTQTFYEAGHDS